MLCHPFRVIVFVAGNYENPAFVTVMTGHN